MKFMVKFSMGRPAGPNIIGVFLIQVKFVNKKELL